MDGDKDKVKQSSHRKFRRGLYRNAKGEVHSLKEAKPFSLSELNMAFVSNVGAVF